MGELPWQARHLQKETQCSKALSGRAQPQIGPQHLPAMPAKQQTGRVAPCRGQILVVVGGDLRTLALPLQGHGPPVARRTVASRALPCPVDVCMTSQGGRDQ